MLALVFPTLSRYYSKSRSLSLGTITRTGAIGSRTPLLGLLTRRRAAPSPLNHPFGLRLTVTPLKLEFRMPRVLDAPRFHDPCPYSLPPPILPFLDLCLLSSLSPPLFDPLCHQTHVRTA